MTTDIMFAINKIEIRLRKEENENTLFNTKDRIPKVTKTAREEVQELNMFLAWLRIESNEGASKPRVSFVVAVEPTTEPTAPILLIKAG